MSECQLFIDEKTNPTGAIYRNKWYTLSE